MTEVENKSSKGAVRQIVYIPPEGSHYTGILSGIYYVNGSQVSEAEFRKDVVNRVLKRAGEVNEVISCPECGSTNIHADNPDEFYYCRDCDHTWDF